VNDLDDLFSIIIDNEKFRSTNYLWNKLRLNSPYSVGYVTTLIESKVFKNKEEWRDFYFQSGEERLDKMHNLGLTDKDKSQLKWQQLAGSHGRTESELKGLGKQLYQEVERQGNSLGITLPECVWMVKYRVIGETWNGVIAREQNTIKTLQGDFPELTFKSCDGETDYRYGIDYEVFDGDERIVAIQIKPDSYRKGRSKAILNAKKSNELKNEAYTEKYQAPVLYIYATTKGNIINVDVKATLSNLIKDREDLVS